MRKFVFLFILFFSRFVGFFFGFQQILTCEEGFDRISFYQKTAGVARSIVPGYVSSDGVSFRYFIDGIFTQAIDTLHQKRKTVAEEKSLSFRTRKFRQQI